MLRRLVTSAVVRGLRHSTASTSSRALSLSSTSLSSRTFSTSSTSISSRALSTSSRHFQAEQEEDMEELMKNPFYKKYAEKLKKVEETKPEEFETKLNILEKEKERVRKEKEETIAAEKKRLQEKASQVQAGKLEALMKTELLQDKSAEEITEIWKKYHEDKPIIFAVIPVGEYEQLMERAEKFKMFIYPVPRDAGYEFFIQQFDGHMINFTPVIAYQAFGENAPVAMNVTHYLDFQDKGIVLMRGEPDTKVLSVHEAQLLALQVKMYYGPNSGLKFNHVRIFNNTPDQFKHKDIVREFENYKKDVQVAKDGTF